MSRGDGYLSETYKRFFYNVAYYRDLDYNQQGHIFENDFYLVIIHLSLFLQRLCINDN